MKRLLNSVISLFIITVMICSLIPDGILANENDKVALSADEINTIDKSVEEINTDAEQEKIEKNDSDSTINSLEELPDINPDENIEEQVVVIYANNNNNIKDLSLTLEDVKSGEQISDRVDVFEASENTRVDDLITELKNNPNVLAVDRNGKIEVAELPNDPYIINGSAWQFQRIGADKTWNTVSNTAAVVVAVIDTGINLQHPDLIGKTVAGYDYVSQQSSVVDIAGHGTMVSGCIAAVANNGIGIAGIGGASNIKIAPYRTGGKYLGDTSLDIAYICAAIMAASDRSDVKVINMSFGGYGDFPTLKTAVQYAVNAGKILVGSAGNEGNSAIDAGRYLNPASYDGVISVAATNKENNHTYFSQYNDQVDLSAPGEAIYTTTTNGSYGFISGTSFSSPIVAGSCAVLKAADPNLTATEVEAVLKDTALDLGNTGKDNYYGYGLVQLDKAVEYVGPKVPLKIDAFLTDKASGQDVNTTIQLSAEASGGTSPYQYKFYYQLGSSTVVIKDYSTDNTAKFSPAEPGTYNLLVDVKDSDNKVISKSINSYMVIKKADKPTANYSGGVILKGSQLVLSTSTEGAVIFYTTDGTDPRKNGTRKNYTTPIIINNDTNFRIVSYKNGMEYSEELVLNFTVRIAMKGIALNKTSLELIKGKSGQLTVSYNPSDTTDNKLVKWTSSDLNVATVDLNGKITAKKAGTATITATVGSMKAQCKVTVKNSVEDISSTYQTHIQNIGWQGWKTEGQISGTSGKSLRLEGIQIKVDNQGYNIGVEYQTHIQNIGWQGFKSNGITSGTSGKSLRLEAIQIRLTGTDADKCDIYYQVHAENYGWLGWAKNGESAGTEGFSYRLEAIKIVVVPKGAAAPGSTDRPFVKNINCSYQTHVENIGWQGWKTKGEISGTIGKSLRLEAIQIKTNDIKNLGIEYQTQIQNIGWQGFKSNGAISGTSGKSLRLEAIQIRLTGVDKDKYDVYYQVHAENYGWLGWAKNGQSAGTEGFGYRLEAIKIVVVQKGTAPPGSTVKPFVKK